MHPSRRLDMISLLYNLLSRAPIYNIDRSKNTTKIREMYIRDPEIYEIGSGTKLLFTFLSLRLSDMRRERHNFFLCWLFLLTLPRVAHFLDPKNQLPSSRLESKLTLFFQIPKSSALPGMTPFMSLVSFPIRGFYCDISDCHIHPACVWTPALNVCT